MKRLTYMCLWLATTTSIGCAPRDPLKAWQKEVDQYVRTHGKGSIDSLRDLALSRSEHWERPALATFGVLSTADGRHGSRRDAMGVLLGYRLVGGRNWYVFLVGIAEVPTQDKPCPDLRVVIDDVRMIAVSASTGRLEWLVSESDQAALARYLRGRTAHAAAESRRTLFPGTFDLYELRVVANTLCATEKRSGASWQVVVPDPQQDRARPAGTAQLNGSTFPASRS